MVGGRALKNTPKQEQKAEYSQRNANRSGNQRYGKRDADNHENYTDNGCDDTTGEPQKEAEEHPDNDKRE